MSKPTFLAPLIGKGAGQCELVYAERGSVLASHVEPSFDSKARKKGLLGREDLPDDYAMIIAPCSAVHTFSMRVPIDLVFVSRNGTITKTVRGVKPWRVASSMRAHAVIEAAEGFIDRHELVPGEVVALRETARATRASEAPAVLEPVPAAEAVPPPKRHTTSKKRVTLADVVASKVPVAWFESVAIVQELCEAVLKRGPADDLRIPELKHIVLAEDGSVVLLADGPGRHSPVQRAGLVLLALTPEEQLPVQLRLLALEEVSPAPRFRSLRELSSELEYFERPDRRRVVIGVFERYMRAMAPEAAAKPVPLPLLEPPTPHKHGSHWWKRKRARTAAALAALALLAAATTWAWRRPEGQWIRHGAGHATAVAVDAARWARYQAGQGFAAAQQAVGVSKQEPKAPGPGVTFVDSSDSSTPRRPVSPEPLPAQPVPGAVQAGAPADASPVGLPLQVESGVWEAIGWAPGTIPPPAAPASGGESAIFTSADTRVVPAGPVRPRLPMGQHRGNEADLPEVELVVSATGEVESVRLVSAGSDAKTAMMLSAVKTWRFQPATLDGEPVRFRFRMKLIG